MTLSRATEWVVPQAGATTTEEVLLRAHDAQSYDASTAFHNVPASTVAPSYYWLFVQTVAEQSMKDTLVRGGFRFDTIDPENGEDPLALTAAEYEALLDTSLDPIEVSQMLGVNVVDVHQRLADHALYGVQTECSWKILGFQFEKGQALPGLAEVLPLLHEELHPIAVYRWFVSPNVDLTVGDERISPRQWLLSGRNIAAVARIAIDL